MNSPVRATKSFLLGTKWVEKGEVFTVDEHQTRRLIEAKAVEPIASVPIKLKATAPRGETRDAK